VAGAQGNKKTYFYFRSLIEKSKDKLELIVRREKNPALSRATANGDIAGKHNYAPQNLFVQPPIDEKNNLVPILYINYPFRPKSFRATLAWNCGQNCIQRFLTNISNN
jgi:hypothetical protein